MKVFSFKEIVDDIKLKVYLGLLLVTHLITASTWRRANLNLDDQVCFPFFPSCLGWFKFLFENWYNAVDLYLFISLIGLLSILFNKTKSAFLLFCFGSVLKFAIHISDYRLMGNYHYMSNIINFSFIFLPNKKNIISIFLILFYASAGSIKFNSDWLSGQAFLKPSFLSDKLSEWVCAYVIILELVLIWLLLIKEYRWKFFVIIQLIFFHLFSWHIVGYFYPSVMLCLISIFILNRDQIQIPIEKINILVVGIFVACQLIPQMMTTNAAVSGRYRILALNMLDAKTECEILFFIRKQNETIEYQPDFRHNGERIHCDPYLVAKRLLKTCQTSAKRKSFLDIDVDIQVRRITDRKNIEQWSFQNVCSKPLTVGVLGDYQQ